MKERPIIFNAEMVRAILDKRKTQTRRTSNLDFINRNPNMWLNPKIEGEEVLFTSIYSPKIKIKKKCPYGKVGDRLYVRETWVNAKDINSYNVNQIMYRAEQWDGDENIKWKPSIFMPKKYARIWLEVTDVRVERVQDISVNDVVKEGVKPQIMIGSLLNNAFYRDDEATYNQFKKLWNSINEKRGYGWDKNPWVWAISFKKLD